MFKNSLSNWVTTATSHLNCKAAALLPVSLSTCKVWWSSKTGILNTGSHYVQASDDNKLRINSNSHKYLPESKSKHTSKTSNERFKNRQWLAYGYPFIPDRAATTEFFQCDSTASWPLRPLIAEA